MDSEPSRMAADGRDVQNREVTTNALDDVLVATFDRDPDSAYLRGAATRIMDAVVNSHCKGLLIDLSPVELLDPIEFSGVRRIVEMAKVIGVRCVLVGIRPEIVSALVDF